MLNLPIACTAFCLFPGALDLVQTATPADFPETLNQAVAAVKRNDEKAARAIVSKFAQTRNQPHGDILLARVFEESGRPAQARALLNQLAAREPERLDIRMSFLGQAVVERRWFDGLTHAAAARKAEPPKHWDSAHVKSVRGNLDWSVALCHAGLGEWKKSRTLAVAVLNGSTPTADRLTFLARCEFELGNPYASLQHFHKARKLEPKLPGPYLLLADLYAENKPKREECYRKALDSGSEQDRVRSRLVYADWLVFENRPESVSELLKEPMKDESADSQRLLLLGASARMRGDLRTAQRYLTRLSQSDPTAFAPSNHLALVLIESKDESLRARALQIAATNVRNHPQSTETWATLGWVQFRLGDIEQGLKNLSKAATGGNISRDTAWYLSRVYGRIGKTTDQATMLEAARTATGPVYVDKAKLQP